jgi:hypothetical protein
MSELLKFGYYRVQLFRNGAHVQWRIWGPGGTVIARGSETSKVKCEKKWRPELKRLMEKTGNEKSKP